MRRRAPLLPARESTAAAACASPSTAPQLREKQKARRYYQLLEKQFRTYYDKAAAPARASPARTCCGCSSAGFDNVLVRLGFAASRRQARQLIRHGHWQINGRRVDIPSYQVRPDDVISIKSGSDADDPVRVATELISTVPPWLQADHDSLTAKILRLPERERDRLAGFRAAHRRAVLEVGAPQNPRRKEAHDHPARIPDPEISAEDVKDNEGSFTIEPLDKGFGYTFGNSLRRVLLSSLEGAAITSVRIEGVAHEFSTVPGVKEDVTDIVLNLKDIVVRMHTDADEVEAPLVATGPGEIKAKDIDLPAGVEILNPDAPIATLEKKTKLEMYLTIGRGRGYSPAEEQQDRGPADRRDPDRLDLLADPARLLPGRLGARRSAHRLRQARRWTSRPTARSSPARRCARRPRS